MSKIDWKRKLTSRKFWCAVVGFVTPLLITFGVDSNQATQIASIIMSGATLIAYIVGEGLTDASNSNTGESIGTEIGTETENVPEKEE